MLSWAHIDLGGSFGALLVGWWLWCTGCISQDTYLLYYNDVICVFEMTMMKADLLMEVWLANMRPDTLWEEET